MLLAAPHEQRSSSRAKHPWRGVTVAQGQEAVTIRPWRASPAKLPQAAAA